MARVHIEKDIYMSVEPFQCTLEKKTIGKTGDSAGKESFVPFGYYTNIKGAVVALIRMKFAASTATTLKELLADMERIEAEVKELIRF